MNDDRPPAPPLPPVDARLADRIPAEVVTPEFLSALLVEGDVELATWALRIALREQPRDVVYDTLVRDAMRLVGDGWQEGRFTISEEHRASQTLVRALEDVAPAGSPSDRIGPVAVLAAAEDEQHAIGLILLEHVLREDGWSVAYLGQNVPAADLVRYVTREQCRLVALSAALSERLGPLADAVNALRALPNPPAIMIGGRALERTAASPAGLRADWSGGSLQEARRFAADLLRRLPDA